MQVREARSRRLASVLLALAVSAGIPAAWTPLREQVPNIDLALLLVVAVVVVGLFGERIGVVVAAISSPLWFEFFATYPYAHFDIQRSPDVETTIGLAAVSFITGELAVRLRSNRRDARQDFEGVSLLRNAAELVASGQELVHIIESAVADLTAVLSLTNCNFESQPSDPSRAQISRDGYLTYQNMRLLRSDDVPEEAELPVIVEDECMGQFVCVFPKYPLPDPAAMLVAVTLADTVAMAFLAHSPPPPSPDRQPFARLRVLQSDSGKILTRAKRRQENSDFSSAFAAWR